MKKLYKLIFIGVVFCSILELVSGCNSFNDRLVKAPYRATVERKMEIVNAKKLLRVNDTEQRVLEFAGKPDEIRNISTSLNNDANRVGYAFIYLLKRDRDHGSLAQRGEENLKIIFNNQGIVTNIEANGHF